MELRENAVVADRFRLMRMIGRGGMGSVWQAQDCRLDNQCAVKFIEGELSNVADAHARFEREAKAAAQLRSPHVVEIKDYGVWQGRPYIAMELLEGEDLGRALAKAGGKLPPGHLNAVIQQVCRALTKAHAAGIVHRDLKPDNIFLVNDDDRQLVKILDFGVAKQTSQALDGSNTKTGAMLGTPYYMSPEQAQGIKSVDSRSDLWSLAVIVYHCLTGRLPFESEALGDLLVKIIVSPVPVPSQVAQVPPGFNRWWAKAADRNPDARFPTAKEFGSALALALGATADAQTRAQGQMTGTAMMQGVLNAPTAMTGPSPNMPNAPTPQPGQHAPYKYPSGHMQTGNPAGAPPTMPTPTGPMMAPGRPPSGPPPAGPHPNLGASHPATFSGVEPPFTVPKKGLPIAVIVGGAAIAVVGLVLIVVAVGKRSPGATATANTGVTASVTASAAPSPTESVAAAASAEPAASTPASAAADSATSATAATTATTTTTVDKTTPAAPQRTAAVATNVAAPAVKPPPKPTTAASARRWNPGF